MKQQLTFRLNEHERQGEGGTGVKRREGTPHPSTSIPRAPSHSTQRRSQEWTHSHRHTVYEDSDRVKNRLMNENHC